MKEGAMRGRLRVLFGRRQIRDLIADVTVGSRRFRATRHMESEYLLIGFVHPRKQQREVLRADFLGEEFTVNMATSLRFKRWPPDDGARGFVTNIEVVKSKQRQGWARALFELYPGTVWTVEAPNEKSGLLILALAQEYPQLIVPPVLDTRYAESDLKRYTTLIDF
jgi:hypothetical protein